MISLRAGERTSATSSSPSISQAETSSVAWVGIFAALALSPFDSLPESLTTCKGVLL
jgi:hypothetical protein